jgi:UDPglucose 6-dehydrogenase
MKIGIIGIGVVGNAVYKSFRNKNMENLYIYDKYKNLGSLDKLYDADIIFLCLPTPYNNELKSYEKSAIYEICENLKENHYKNLVVIKSTIEPETSENLSTKYSYSICHNPEFLTANTAYEDFENQKHIVIGKTKNCKKENFENLINFYKKYYPNAEISLCNSTESELMKLGVNNFYSVKIQFFNELYLLANSLDNIDYNKIKDLMIKNGWIHPMHTNVPGPDGKMSYGGMCFPKDTNALLQYMKKIGSPCKVLEATIDERNILRDD